MDTPQSINCIGCQQAYLRVVAGDSQALCRLCGCGFLRASKQKEHQAAAPKAEQVDPAIQLALDHSRNFATAKVNIGSTEKEHILGLCDLLERTAKGFPPPKSLVLAAEEVTPKACWSSNNEEFDCDSLSELLDNMAANETPKAGDVVYVGDAIPPKFSELVEADMVIDGIIDRAFDYAGEYADNYPDVSKEEKAELQAMLERWLASVDTPRFYIVKNIREYVLTGDDVAPYQDLPAATVDIEAPQ